MRFTIYESTGKILRTGIAPDNMIAAQTQAGEFLVGEPGNDLTQYIPDVANPVITQRPANTTTVDKTTVTADGVDKIILSAIPLNSVITLANTKDANIAPVVTTTTTATIDLVFDIPGTYKLKVELFPYLPFEATINAN